MSYPVSSGIVREYIVPDYISDHPIIPHGISVALNAPEGGELLPRPAGPDKLADLFKDAMQYW